MAIGVTSDMPGQFIAAVRAGTIFLCPLPIANRHDIANDEFELKFFGA